jgi:hypothetical protein
MISDAGQIVRRCTAVRLSSARTINGLMRLVSAGHAEQNRGGGKHRVQTAGPPEKVSQVGTSAALRLHRASAADFDLINSESNDVRLSLGSVHARSGQLVYFDSTTGTIRAEHVMASGVSRGRNRRRTQLGWRRRLEHALGMALQTSPAGHGRRYGCSPEAHGSRFPLTVKSV